MNKSLWYIGTKNISIINAEGQTKYSKYYLKYHENGKFENDHIFSEFKDCFIILDGVVFNKKELEKKYSTWIEAIYSLKDERDFPNMLRGSFSGAIIYNDGRLQVFTDHCGDKPIFIYNSKDATVICTELLIYKNLAASGDILLSAYKPYFKYMLSFGFMIDNSTCYKEVKRLMPGQIMMLFNEKQAVVKFYHKFSNIKTSNLNDKEAIAEIDRLFRNAIKLEFGKDEEYGYKHIIDISGGLDCRIVNYVAKDMGYDNILNITYSQMESNEFKAALKMARHLDNELIFYPLDNAKFIFDVEKIIKMNNGLCVYATSTGVSKILALIDTDFVGIEHGGLLGDIRDGSFPGKTYYKHRKANVSRGMQFSETFKLTDDIPEISSLYENQEMFDVYTRGMLGGLSTIMIRNYYLEYFAPFMDPDFYDFYLSMPLEQRVERKIFKKWIKEYYPQAYTVEDDRTMCRVDASKYARLIAKIKTKVEREMNKFGMKHDLFYKQNSMNPFEYWYKTKPKVRKFAEDYYEENKYFLNKDIELETICDAIMKKGNLRDITMVLSILSVLKNYF